MEYVTPNGKIKVIRNYTLKGESGVDHKFDVAYKLNGRLRVLVDFFPTDSKDFTPLIFCIKMIDLKNEFRKLEGISYLLVVPPEERE